FRPCYHHERRYPSNSALQRTRTATAICATADGCRSAAGPLSSVVSLSSLGSGWITFRCRFWFARIRMSDRPSAPKSKKPQPGMEPMPVRRPVSRAKERRPTLWQRGALFHVTTRYPRKARAARVDRLAGILRNGLLAPASCQDGSVFSDLNLLVT